MAEDFIRFAFTGGVFSKSLLGRSDVEKYDLGLAEGQNWFVHYQGGASTRPGTQFLDYIQDDDRDVRIAEFRYSSRLADVYLLVFSKDRLRFMQNGAYVLETAKPIASFTGSGTFTVTAHGFANNDWVKLTGFAGPGTYEVFDATANTFMLRKPDRTRLRPDEDYNASMAVARIYTLASPFTPGSLHDLSFSQIRDEVIITSLDYPPHKLTRLAAASWTLEEIDFNGNTAAPGTLTLTPQVAGTAGVTYGITAVDQAGQESYVANYAVTELTKNFTTTAGSIKLTWTAVAEAQYYNVYRSIVFPLGADALVSQELGFIGRAAAPEFTDANIVPDFTSPPPQHNNPFALGKIVSIDMTASGSGYTKTGAGISITGSGSGFIGKPVVNSAGQIIGVVIINPGEGYVDPIVTFSGGTGATATATASAVSGTYPRASTLLQQRRIYAGTENRPLTIFGSHPGQPEIFSSSQYGSAADALELTLDAADVNPIKFCATYTGGMLAFTESAVHSIQGAEGKVISPLTAVAEPLSGAGIADVPPIYLEKEFLYVTNAGTEVRMLRPEAVGNLTQVLNVSLYSSDFFSQANIIKSWAFAKEPYRLIWAQREDGTFLSLTTMPDQNVYAWSHHDTQGLVKQIAALTERGRDRVYFVVERTVGGRARKYLERFGFRDVRTVERMYAVDSGLQTALPEPEATLTLSSTFAMTSEDVFTDEDVGAHLRAGDGRAIITAVNGPQEAEIAWQMELTERLPQSDDYRSYASGSWSLAPRYSTVSGLHHLEGKTVQVFADGNVQQEKTVIDGAIELDSEASLVSVGLGYSATLKTLPLYAQEAILAAKGKRIVGAALRLLDSRGLLVGEGDTLYAMKERTTEQLDEPTRFQSGLKEIAIASSWDFDGSLTIKKTGPLNATLLGLVLKAELSDD